MIKITELRLKCDKCNTENGQPYDLIKIDILGKHCISTKYKCKCLNCGNDYETYMLTECEHLDTTRVLSN